jgi:hypothetical protein
MAHEIIRRVKDIDDRRNAEQLAAAGEHIAKLAAPLKRSTSRRDLLKTSLATAAAALCTGFLGGNTFQRTLRADDAVKTGKFIFPRLKFSVKDETKDIWNTGLRGDAILRKHLRDLTNINASDEPKTVRLADFDDLCRHPFVFMTSEGDFKLPENEEKNLREFLERGGFIHADDCVFAKAGKHEDRFFRAYVSMIDRLFPDNPMRKVPLDNEIFHIYFDFPKGCPFMQGVDHGMWGQFEPGTGRIRTVATPGDLHCGWMCEYFGKEKDMQAIKMGINIIIYFLSH